MTASASRIQQSSFGRTTDGQEVTRYVLESPGGMRIELLDFGGVVRCLHVPDRNGRLVDVVLGFDDIASYEADRAYIGAIVGRYANRISGGRFVLDGRTYDLATNDGTHHLHGGVRGFNKAIWNAQPFDDGDIAGVALEHTSPDGDEGYPGQLSVQVRYAVSSSNVFSVEYRATTDAPTPVNLTQHSYFNLAGEGSGDVLGHELTIHADSFIEIDSGLIPTGKYAPVEGTSLAFRRPHLIGERIDSSDEQVRVARGYDHSFVLSKESRALSPAARASNSVSGIAMEVLTTEPGMQLYSGNFLDAAIPGKHGHQYNFRSAFCLETQHFPDSPNHPEFPSTILRPGDELRSRTEYRFSTE